MDENQVGKKRRARRSGKEVQRLVEEFISGGMKRSEFCRSRGLSPGTLRRRLEGGKQEGEANSATGCGRVGGKGTPKGQRDRGGIGSRAKS